MKFSEVAQSRPITIQNCQFSRVRYWRTRYPAQLILLTLVCLCSADGQQVENGLLRVGGFRCASLKSLGNDSSLDLYKTGYWNYTGFRMEVWRRLGVPFWYPKNTGVVRVAGEGWHADLGDDISSADAGGKAKEVFEGETATSSQGIDPHVDDENAASNANDGDKSTGWAPAGQKSSGKLVITFAAPARVNTIRFLSDDAPRNTP